MNRRDIVIGVIVLSALAGIIYYWQGSDEQEELIIPETLSVEDIIEERFNIVIPDDVEKAELSDSLGGDSSAIATRSYENGNFEMTILADLPETEGVGYLARILDDDQQVDLGSLRQAKGGYLINYNSQTDLSGYNTVQILRGSDVVLEGSF